RRHRPKLASESRRPSWFLFSSQKFWSPPQQWSPRGLRRRALARASAATRQKSFVSSIIRHARRRKAAPSLCARRSRRTQHIQAARAAAPELSAQAQAAPESASTTGSGNRRKLFRAEIFPVPG